MQENSVTPVSRLVGEAVELAFESYDQNLARTLIAPENAKLRHAVEGEYPDDTFFTTKDAIEEFEAQKKKLLEMAAKSSDGDELLRQFDRYIHQRIDDLFYENNDVRMAQIMRDFTDQFVIATIGTLRPKGLMTDEQAADMRRLLGLYDTCITTSLNVQVEIRQQTHGEFGNLIDWASNDLIRQRGQEAIAREDEATNRSILGPGDMAAKNKAFFEELHSRHRKKRTHVQVTAEEVEAHARELFRSLMNDRFNTNYSGDQYPHPALYMVCASAEVAAQRKVAYEIDRDDPPPPDEINARIKAYYKTFMADVEASFKDHPYQVHFETVLEKLEHECNVISRVPDDFSTQLGKAVDKAESLTAAALTRRFREWEKEAKLHWSDGRNLGEQMALEIGSLERTGKILRERMKNWDDKLESCDSVDAVMTQLDLASSHLLYNVTFACDEPAVLLLMKDYVQSLGKSMIAMQQKHGFDAGRTREGFAALEGKLDHAYEAYRVNRDWCLELSHGAYDDYGLYALTSTGNMAGLHYNQLSEKQKAEIPKLAADLMIGTSQAQWLPADLAGNPWVPMLFEACKERATRDYNNDHPLEREHTRFSDRYREPAQLGKRATRRVVNAEIDRASSITGMALGLLDNVIAHFPGGEPPEKEPEFGHPTDAWRDPQINANGLAECMQFFDEAKTRGRLH